jgi:hypothetical protein
MKIEKLLTYEQAKQFVIENLENGAYPYYLTLTKRYYVPVTKSELIAKFQEEQTNGRKRAYELLDKEMNFIQ